MKNTYRGYQFELYPTEEQKEKFSQDFGTYRYIYNYLLNLQKETYKNEKRYISKFDMTKEITKLKKVEGQEFLSLTSKDTLDLAAEDLDNSYQMFFKGINERPDFKAKYRSELRVRYRGGRRKEKNGKRSTDKIRFEGSYIVLPKIGKVKCSFGRRPAECFYIRKVKVKLTPSNRYYCFIMAEDIVEELPKTGKVIGIDMGLTDFIITSDGEKFENKHFTKELEDKLKREQRILSRKKEENVQERTYKINKKGQRVVDKTIYKRPLNECKNYQKQKIKKAKIEEKIRNQRTYYQQTLSTQLVRDYDVICLESLQVQKMMQGKNKNKNRAIGDAAWSSFIQMLKYKAEWYGKEVVQIDTWFPSSQLCNDCGYRYDPKDFNGIKWKDRKGVDYKKWTCPHCHTEHDRDINAAKNILKEGLRIRDEDVSNTI